MINRLMNRIVAALGDKDLLSAAVTDENGLEKPSAPAMSLLSFISACKGMKSTSASGSKGSIAASVKDGNAATVSVRERLVQIIYEANENNRAYYLEERVKQLFGRCLRMFFFYQKKDVYETLMLHDYGFYQFARFKNYVDHGKDGEAYPQLAPLFTTRE